MRRQRKKKEGGRRQTGSSRRHVTEDMSFSPLVSLYAAASGPSSYNLEKEEGRHSAAVNQPGGGGGGAFTFYPRPR
jgi:hypothetical protein